ncbi:AcsL3 [Desulfamplus magnetovallimortis]|uniref:AcsL3 n=1 Tax=Desulfamplus magnetovallimortis TaxID=1246637 RepID=A0A1W1HDG5_9BACT|nr:AMP-binding protein [Desulfamplus magnetovallimortis]SLM30519.1 AcsL3 [Desulfamplus magnetovallimortis]
MNFSVNCFNIYDMIRRNATLFAKSTAIVHANEKISFQEYFLLVNSLAASLLDNGVKSGDRVAILAMNSPAYLILYGAASAIGAILVPVNWRLSEDEIAYILEDSGAILLFFDESQKKLAFSLKNTLKYKGKLADLCSSGKGISCLNEEKSLDSAEKEEILSYDKMISSEHKWQGPSICEEYPVFCLIYTAAVAGKPRGAALSHSNIITANLQTSLVMYLDKNDAYLNMLPLFHITGMNLALAVMHMGGRNVIIEKFDAPRALGLVDREKVTLMASFPPILSTLMTHMKDNADQGQGFDIDSLKNVVGIDSPENIEKFTQKTGCRFWVLYGQSETSGFVTLSDSSESPGSAGRPCPVSRLSILDGADRELPLGKSGEIGVRGPVIFKGFWLKDGSCNTKSMQDKNYQGTSEGFSFDQSTIRNGWHHTGDIGHLDQDGYLWFEGRKPEKELIKPGGENVYPAEVESVVMLHPGIENCCVIGVPDPKFGEGVKAVCVRKIDFSVTESELIAFVGERIARYKKPGYVQFVNELPMTNDGIVDRSEVKLLYGSNGE